LYYKALTFVCTPTSSLLFLYRPQLEMSGFEEVSLTERYRRKAQATEGSFIK